MKVATFTRAGMADVPGAVVANLEQRGMQGALERRTQAVDARHEGLSLENTPRSVHSTTANVNTMATGGAIHTLNNTQSASLRFSATQMLTRPSAT